MTQPDLVSKLRELSANWPHNQRRHGDLTWVCRATCQRCELESLLGREGQAARSKWCAKYGGLYDGDYCSLCDCELKRSLATCGPSQPETDFGTAEEVIAGLDGIIAHNSDVALAHSAFLSPSTPIVPSTPDDPRFNGVVVEVAEEFAILDEDIPRLRRILARLQPAAGLSAEQIASAIAANKLLPDPPGGFDMEGIAKDLNALLGAAKPGIDWVAQNKLAQADEKRDCEKALLALAGWYPTPVEGYGFNTSWAISDLCKAIAGLREREAQIRKDVLEEAAQLLKYYGHSANLVDEIRALAERPAPAGEVKGEK